VIRHRHGRGGAVKKRIVRDGRCERVAASKLDQGRTVVAPKRVGLIGPVKVAQRPREAAEVVLRLVVLLKREHRLLGGWVTV